MHWGIVLSLENIGNTSIKHTIKINIIYCFDSSSNWMKSNGRGEMRHTYLSNAQGSCLLNSLLKSCLYQRTTRKESFLFYFRSSFQVKMVSMMVTIATVFVLKNHQLWKKPVAWHFANHIFAIISKCFFLVTLAKVKR